MITFKGVRKSWLIDFRESALSKVPEKGVALTVACFCGTFTGFTLLILSARIYSSRELRGCETSCHIIFNSRAHVEQRRFAEILGISSRTRSRDDDFSAT